MTLSDAEALLLKQAQALADDQGWFAGVARSMPSVSHSLPFLTRCVDPCVLFDKEHLLWTSRSARINQIIGHRS